MQVGQIKLCLFLAGLAALFSAGIQAQTDVAASLYGAFSPSVSANGTTQSPSNSAGVLVELRHISNPLVGWEATYAYNRANQKYTEQVTCGSGVVICGAETENVPADAHEITGDWVVSLKVANLRPFALTGGGLLLNVPEANPGPIVVAGATTHTATKGVFVYGAGLDWTLLPHLGLRFQYRGNLYKAANLTNVFTSTNAFTQTAEPMVGAFLRF